jgi:hypothetical protein
MLIDKKFYKADRKADITIEQVFQHRALRQLRNLQRVLVEILKCRSAAGTSWVSSIKKQGIDAISGDLFY